MSFADVGTRFIGAFEKIGPLKRDRALAKIAVVWKKRQDIKPDVDT